MRGLVDPAQYRRATTQERAFPSRSSRWDGAMVWLAAAHAALLIAAPSVPLIALGVWWNSNTIAHHFIHRRFFQSRAANLSFAAGLSLLLGIPQRLWRDRHLAHHAGVPARLRLSRELAGQTALVLALWSSIAARAPRFFLSVYLPGYLAGLGLCALHGYYEHSSGAGGVSHYGAFYNLLLFNDGYHAEHHATPAVHWTRLPERRVTAARISPWPAPLRWMEALSLESIEKLVLRSPMLQRWVLRTHARAFRELLRTLPRIESVAIVGGALFPRTALVLENLLPAAHITIIDASRAHLEQARARLPGRSIEFVHASYRAGDPADCDLLVIPLSFAGDREAIYAHPPAPAVLVHDWIWRRRGTGRIVSVGLAKRLNLVRP